MPFTLGDRVHVATIGTGVVREARNRGRYVVEIKGQSFVVNEVQLTAADPIKRGSSKSVTDSDTPASRSTTRVGSPPQLDLHGMTTIEAIVALDVFINDAILAGYDSVRVIHGRSGGRLKAAVHARLREVTAVKRFGVDSANHGVTIVDF